MTNRKVLALASVAGLGLLAVGCEEKPKTVTPPKAAVPAATTPAPAVPAATTPAAPK